MDKFVNEKSDLQFYPTPPELAERAWAKFKNREFVRVLEPSAGDGRLAAGNPRYDDRRNSWRGPQIEVDCIEIDVSKHPLLREAGFNVVGVDFGQFNGAGAIYSHIIMNPPFLEGAKHVLKAWDLLYDGEIVAILNAETVLNPFSKERRLLVQLIGQHGDVEFIEGAFAGPEAERKTDVGVALVYLRKQSSFSKDLLGDILEGLDREGHHGLDAGYREANDLAIPGTFIENSVKSFEAAVRAMRQSVFAEARYAGYAARLGKSMEQLDAENGEADITKTANSSLAWVQSTMHTRYSDLKARAWTGILRSTQVLSKLSSAAQKRVESEFENIKQLEFSVSNIYGFLGGLIAKQADIQLDMACDVFDLITRYHSDNTVFYMGWKSNDKHRTCGLRIKSTRFVLPGHKTESFQKSISWDSERLLADFDKVFALLDGKAAPELGLVELFKKDFAALRVRNTRMSSTYFDVRYFPNAGTIHFFPRSKKLMDRLNRLVGAHRKWLPPEGERVSDAFWLQYESAEKFDKEVRDTAMKGVTRHWDNPLDKATSGNSENRDEGMAKMAEALAQVLANNGIDPNALLEVAPAGPALEDKARLAA